MTTLILQVHSAGVGDVLIQINKFLWACELIGLDGQIILDHKKLNERNPSAKGLKLFEYLGLSSIESETLGRAKLDKMSQIFFRDLLDIITSGDAGSWVKTHQRLLIKFHPTKDHIKNDTFISMINENHDFDVGRAGIGCHPKLQNLINESDFAKDVNSRLEQKDASNKRNVTLHMRRGDVAIAKASVLNKFRVSDIDDSFLINGELLFKQDESEQVLSKPILKRQCSVEAMLEKAQAEGINTDNSVITVISDGFTVLSRSHFEAHKDSFKEFASPRKFERILNQELNPLLDIASHSVIGEDGNKLIESLIEAISSDVIISFARSSFLQLLSHALRGGKIDMIAISQE